MNPLGDAYRQLDQDTHNYADAGRALSVLRRRRAGKAALVAGSAAVLVIAGGIGLQQRLSGPPDVATTLASPTHVIKPPATAPRLPSAGSVGPGAMVYTACRSACPTFLVLQNGQQHVLGERTVNPPGNITLSPDGRWLGQPTTGGYEVRDLLGGTVHTLQPPAGGREDSAYSPWAWSADSRRLILGYHASGDVSAYAELDLGSGRITKPELSMGQEPVGVLPSGELLLLDESQYGKTPLDRVTLKLADSGRTMVLASEAGVLADADHGLWIQVSGERIFTLAHSGDAVTVLEFDITGKRVARMPLLADQYPVGPVADGFAIIQVPQDQRNGHQKLESLSPSGRRLLFEVPGLASIVLPGAARH
ncbi:hypothetical protein ACQPYK_38415 [Streptosporangium sp. CA-135522]|uniref:hypothetical protein n=1 Tax=Streptosporangium sp. CA-135522 TaxID=3240072 RepID=UPI003D8D2679